MMIRWGGFGLAAVIVAVSIALQFSAPGGVVGIRQLVFDAYQTAWPRQPAATKVRIVDIDDESLLRMGQWPWPRNELAGLVDRVREDGARIVALDILFSEPDRLSPARVLAPYRLDPTIAETIGELPDHDVVFATALASLPSVAAFSLLPAIGAPPEIKARLITRPDGAAPTVPSFRGSVQAVPALRAAAAGMGSINFLPGRDGIVRRVPVVLQADDSLVPSLSAEIVRLARRKRTIVVETGRGEIESVRVGGIPIETDGDGGLWLHYRPLDRTQYIPAWHLVEGGFAAGAFDDAIVIIGTSASGLLDIRFSPLGQLIPGVDVHAQAVEQMLDGTYLRRPAWAPGLEILTTLLLGLGLAALGTFSNARWTTLGLVAAIVGAAGLGAWFFLSWRFLFDPGMPLLTAVAAGLTATLWQLSRRERQNRFIRGAFARYISPNLVQYLTRRPDALSLGGQRRECSFVMTDLIGFTSTVEKSDPESLVGLLNDYLDGMVEIAFRHEGTLDRIVGDAVAVMFSAPVEQSDHARRALACAIDMNAFVLRFIAERRERIPDLRGTRIGVNTGPVIIGNFGGTRAFDYRALGDTVNATARLEHVNGILGTRVCVGETTVVAAGAEARVRPIGTLRLRGRAATMRAFEPHGASGLTADEVARYMTAWTMLENGEATALEAFDALAKETGDPLAAFHRDRLARGERGIEIDATVPA